MPDDLIRPEVLLAIKAILAIAAGIACWLMFRGVRSLLDQNSDLRKRLEEKE